MLSIEGQTALITGGAKRLGRSIALTLARAGANVVIHYRSSYTEAEATAEAARALGVDAFTASADLGEPDAAAALYQAAVAKAGPIDILVNNASIFPAGGLVDSSEAVLRAVMQLHAMAPLQLSRCMAAAGRSGGIINLLDTRVARHDPDHAAYSFSKRMLAELTRLLAIDLAPRIRVNGVAPGPILPPEGARDGFMETLAARVPLQRTGAPDDIAEAVLFLARSVFVTGQILFVDGGDHLAS